MNRVSVVLFFFLLSFTASYTTDAIIIHNDKLYFHVDNETYNTSSMNFSRITINDVYIRFNTTSFYVTSPNPISILLTFLNSSIVNADTSDMIINFTADTSGGKVWFNLSGFKPYTNYTVNRSSVFYTDMKANGSGFISWNNSLWDSAKSFTVYVASYTPFIFIPTIAKEHFTLFLAIMMFFIPLYLVFRPKKPKMQKSFILHK